MGVREEMTLPKAEGHKTHSRSSHMLAVLVNGSHWGPRATWAEGSLHAPGPHGDVMLWG